VSKYHLKIKRSAEKELEALPYKVILKIKADVLSLAEDPFPKGHKKLKGLKDMYRIRVGDYRIIYTIHPQIITIEILKIGHRKDIYG
jgi:mRNA interferase RelE/StbE